jgi:hypothetical protein
MVNLQEYFNNLGNALVGKNVSGFVDASGETISTPAANVPVGVLGAFAFVWLIGIALLVICNLYGAVRLSWCYNTYLGTSPGLKVVYAILCFFFPVFYYPFYGVFLDPLCGIKKNINGRNVRI